MSGLNFEHYECHDPYNNRGNAGNFTHTIFYKPLRKYGNNGKESHRKWLFEQSDIISTKSNYNAILSTTMNNKNKNKNKRIKK
jgi:hypothetical protein